MEKGKPTAGRGGQPFEVPNRHLKMGNIQGLGAALSYHITK